MRHPLFARPEWTRRGFLQRSAAVAAGAYGMRWDLADAAEIPLEFDGSKFQLAAPEPNPKHGGVVRMGIPCGRRISTSTSPAPSSTSVRWDACSTI
jgi:hypothetical protein